MQLKSNFQLQMKYVFITIFFLLLGFFSNTASADNEKELKALDESLNKRDFFEQKRIQRIDVLKKELGLSKNFSEQFEKSYSLYNEYKSYCYDSAEVYSKKCLAIAQKTGREDDIVKARHAMAFCLVSAGFLSEAAEVMASVKETALNDSLRVDHYEIYSQLWRSMADYVRQDPYYTKYISRSNAYLDSLRAIVPEKSVRWWSYTGSLQMRQHEYEDALISFRKVLELCGDDLHQKAMTAAEMGWAYIYLNDEDKAISYFAQSALADNESATREITALYHLSRLIYKRGDSERASRYVHQALEDINFYNTRLRKVEINDILPIIEQQRYDALRAQRNLFVALSILFVVLIGVILYSLWFNRKKNRKLMEAQETIANNMKRLEEKNLQLQEADKIKIAYIGQSLYANAEFIEKVEKLFLALDRKIMARQYDDLRYTVKQSTLNEERENMYAAFDDTFLNLFPNFVERYNELFDEKDRKVPTRERSLTSEMRIFALIRLGISDSERIARFLDYSVHTVNTYKTRIKNRSIVENDQFDRLIMEI